jgi:predicted TIM-barrel fold metal-dependent hydrolase
MEIRDHIGLWRSQIASWLPRLLFDSHIHLSPPEAVGPISAERRKVALTTFTHMRLEELEAIYRNLFPGRTIVGLIAFPFPQYEVDIEAANEYIGAIALRNRHVKGFLLAHPTDAGRTLRQYEDLRRKGVRIYGIKPYFDLLRKSNYVTTMDEFIPERLLEFMDDQKLILMLHTSSIGMADPEDQRYVKWAVRKHPGIKIILAHLGRYLQVGQFLAFTDSDVMDSPSVYLDASFATKVEAYERILSRQEWWSRLLFGTDIPFGLFTGVEDWKPEVGSVILTRDTYAWSDPAIDARFAQERRVLTYNTYHVIEAIKQAMERLGITGTEAECLKQKIFCENAASLFAGDGASVPSGA